MNKICIIGGSGTGKTTLADNLGRVLNLPVYHIDGIHHLSDWQIRDKGERDEIIYSIMQKEKWIIDGTYTSTLEERLKNADEIIYLDYSSFAQVKGVMTRYIKHHGKEREEIPGCKERMTWHFFWFVVNWRKNKRKSIIEKLEKIDEEKVHIFKNRKELNNWYERKFNKKIECK